MMPLVRMSPSTALKCAGWPSSAKSPLIAATAPEALPRSTEGVACEVMTGPVDAGLDGVPGLLRLGGELQHADLDRPVGVSDRRQREAGAGVAGAAWRARPSTVAWTAAGSDAGGRTAVPARRARAAARASRRSVGTG